MAKTRRNRPLPDLDRPLRVAVYLRVSTGRQAQHDLSVPDQRNQAERYCRDKGWTIVAEFKDAGISGTTTNRPGYQKMYELARSGEAPFDVILVYSVTRFFRNLLEQELAVIEFRRNGIHLVSIRETITGEMTLQRQVFGAMAEEYSRQNSDNTLRTMNENARQRFWNGSQPPFGYGLVEVERRGDKIKKRLAVDPVEAETVRMIFRLYLEGDGSSGPMGVKAVADWLNQRSYFTRRGYRWGLSTLHQALTRTTYKGIHRFNRRNWSTGEEKPEDEVISYAVDPIIDAAMFDRAQALLKAKNPKVTPPRVASGGTLLAGIGTCATCGGGMTLRTGKSGRYRYYTCAAAAQKGKSACKGRSIRMDKLDQIVTDEIVERIVSHGRMRELLTRLVERQNLRRSDITDRLAGLRKRASEAEDRLGRLYALIEQGVMDPAEPTLRDRLASARNDRDIARVSYDRAAAELKPDHAVTEEKIAAFSNLMTENIMSGDVKFRRAYIRAIIDQVEVDDQEIRISWTQIGS